MTSRLLLAGALSAGLVACGSPSGPGGQQPLLVHLTMTGPSSVAPGTTAALLASGTMSDGTTVDETAKVLWRVANGLVLSVSPSGVVTAKTAGESLVSAALGPLTATLNILAVPPGTTRLTGTVREFGVPLVGVTVSVISGVGAGLSTTTDASGVYRLYGVAGTIQIQASEAGYETAVQTVTASGGTVDFALIRSGPVPDVSGVYALQVTASSSCATQSPALPADLRQRQYAATITQTGPSLQVVLGGATFSTVAGHGNNFAGYVKPDGITFQLGDGYYTPYADLLESLSDGKVLMVYGTVTAPYGGTDIAGVLDGSIVVGKPPVWSNNWVTGFCNAPNNQFVFTRQSAPAARIRR